MIYYRGYQTKVSPVYGYNPEVNTESDQSLPGHVLQSRAENSQAFRYQEAFRRHGYKYASLNPVSTEEIPLGGWIITNKYQIQIPRFVFEVLSWMRRGSA